MTVVLWVAAPKGLPVISLAEQTAGRITAPQVTPSGGVTTSALGWGSPDTLLTSSNTIQKMKTTYTVL